MLRKRRWNIAGIAAKLPPLVDLDDASGVAADDQRMPEPRLQFVTSAVHDAGLMDVDGAARQQGFHA